MKDPINGVIHRFADQLEYSVTLSDEPAWLVFYQRLWPDMRLCIRHDGASRTQKDGIDREIVLANNKRFLIDEKKRKKDYGDVLLEEWSVWRGDGDCTNRIGWALDADKRCDFVAYAIPASCKCFLLPFELLRQAFLAHRSEWTRDDRCIKDAWNDGYLTRSVAVGWPTLKAAIVEQMLRRFDAVALELPKATQFGKQLEFPWAPE